MKKVLFLFFVWILNLHSFEITMNKEFIKEVQPNSLSLNITLSTFQKTPQEALEKLEFYANFLKSFNNIDIKGGEFNTYPRFRYEKNKRIKEGYQGRVTFLVSAKDQKSLKDFLSMLLANSFDEVDISISSGGWKLDKKEILKEQDELKFQALNWADEYAKKLSNKTNRVCTIKSVNFDENFYVPPVIYGEAVKVKKRKVISMPKKSKQKIKLRAKFKFECK